MAEAQPKNDDDPTDTCIIGVARGMLADLEDGEGDEVFFRLIMAIVQSVMALEDSGQVPAGVLMSADQLDAVTAELGAGPFSLAGKDLVFQAGDVEAPTAYAKAA